MQEMIAFYVTLSHFHSCMSVLFMLLFYVKVIPLLESICRLGYFVFVLWKKFAHVFAWPRDRLECVGSWIHCEKINIFLQFLTQCCNCWRRIQQVSCYNTNVDIKFSGTTRFWNNCHRVHLKGERLESQIILKFSGEATKTNLRLDYTNHYSMITPRVRFTG